MRADGESNSRQPLTSTQPDSDVMVLEEAARFLRVHPRTIKRNAATLKIPYRRLGSLWRFSRTELQSWIRDNQGRV